MINAQVLNEFTMYANKSAALLGGDRALFVCYSSRFKTVVPLTLETHAAAVTLARDHCVRSTTP